MCVCVCVCVWRTCNCLLWLLENSKLSFLEQNFATFQLNLFSIIFYSLSF